MRSGWGMGRGLSTHQGRPTKTPRWGVVETFLRRTSSRQNNEGVQKKRKKRRRTRSVQEGGRLRESKARSRCPKPRVLFVN